MIQGSRSTDVASRGRIQGALHYLILNSMELLSDLHRLQGRCEEAEKLALEVVNSRKAPLNPDNSELLMSIRMLVAV